MTKVKAVLGYIIAALCIPLALATFMGLMPAARALVAVTGLEITPWFSGGDALRSSSHGAYQTTLHAAVFQALIGERREGFVQVDWTPAAGLPARLQEEIDFDGDGAADFRIALDTETCQARLTALNPLVLGLEGCYELKDGRAVRVKLRNPRR